MDWNDNSDVCRDRSDAICSRGNLQLNVTAQDEGSEFVCLVQFGENNRKSQFSDTAQLIVAAKGISIMSIFVFCKPPVLKINLGNSGNELI